MHEARYWCVQVKKRQQFVFETLKIVMKVMKIFECMNDVLLVLSRKPNTVMLDEKSAVKSFLVAMFKACFLSVTAKFCKNHYVNIAFFLQQLIQFHRGSSRVTMLQLLHAVSEYELVFPALLHIASQCQDVKGMHIFNRICSAYKYANCSWSITGIIA